ARRRMDLDVAIERRVGILQAKIALAAAEQRHENLAEVFAHLGECSEEQLPRRAVDLTDRLLQRLFRLSEIGALAGEEVLPLDGFLVLFDREHVHRAKLLELLPERLGFSTECVVVYPDGL